MSLRDYFRNKSLGYLLGKWKEDHAPQFVDSYTYEVFGDVIYIKVYFTEDLRDRDVVFLYETIGEVLLEPDFTFMGVTLYWDNKEICASFRDNKR